MPNPQGASKTSKPNLKNHTKNFNQQSIQSKNHSEGLFGGIQPLSSKNRTYANVTSNQEPPKSDDSNQFYTQVPYYLNLSVTSKLSLIHCLSLLTTVLAKLASQNDK